MRAPPRAVESLDGESHIWMMDSGRPLGAELLADYREMLSPEEGEHYDRVRHSQARREFLLGRALARTTLSRYHDVKPAEWVFRLSPHGRPEIVRPPGHDDLRFNLSHTRRLIGCAVTRGVDVGIDVEEIGRTGKPLELAERRFAPAEVETLRRLGSSELDEHFCFLWTLKEAFLKACGRGMALGLRSSSFALAENGILEVEFTPELGETTGAWQVALFRPSSRLVLAVAIRRGEMDDLRIRLWEARPLTDELRVRELPLVAATKPPDGRHGVRPLQIPQP